MKKAMSIVLSAVLALSMVGCTVKSPATVLTVEGIEIPAGIYLYYQSNAANIAATKVEDKSKDIYKQEIEGKSAEEWIHEQTISLIKSYIYMDKMFAEKKLELSEDDKKGIDDQVNNAWEQGEKMFVANGIGKETLRTVAQHGVVQSRIYSEVFVKDSANAVEDAAAKEYMNKTYSHIVGLTLPTIDKSYQALADDKVKEIKAIGDAVLADIKGGKKLDEASAKAALNKVFAITGHEMSDELFSSFFTTEYLRSESTNMPKETLDVLLAAKVGDSGVQEVGAMPYVWSKIENFETAEEFDMYKLSIANEIQAAAFEDSIKAATASYEVIEDASAVKTYSPKKIKQVK